MVDIEIKRHETKIKPKFNSKEECKKLPVLHASVKHDYMVVTWSGEECIMLEMTDKEDNLKLKKLVYPGVDNVVTQKDISPFDGIDHS